jgi:6-pyruvoyltetrahydropterin/6-carboxytetrahydropterin synthase
MIRITKIFRFETAHLLSGYNGPCRNIHGHSYELHVTVKGIPARDDHNPNDGMVMEFSVLKSIVNEQIISRLDHALIMPEKSDKILIRLLTDTGQQVVVTPFQPTCENLLADFAKRISHSLPAQVSLHKLRLYETASSYAEWSADDH